MTGNISQALVVHKKIYYTAASDKTVFIEAASAGSSFGLPDFLNFPPFIDLRRFAHDLLALVFEIRLLPLF